MDDVSLQKLRAEVARDLTPVRPLRPAWMRALLLLPCAALSFALLALLFPRWQLNGLAWTLAALQLLVAYGILWVGLREAVPGQGPGVPALAVAALVATFAVGGANAALLVLRPMAVPPGQDWPYVVHCFRIELLLGLPAVGLGFWLATRGFPLRPVVAGLLGGLSAGVAASGIWSLFCPLNEVIHLLASHIAPIAAVALFGVFAGSWWSRRQRSRRTRRDLV
jgi:hypothetical protein